MVNFLCTPPCSRIALTVAMGTMHFFIVQLSLSLRTKNLCISGVPMNDLAPMKNCPGGGGCKVGQISSRGNGVSLTLIYFTAMSNLVSFQWKKKWKYWIFRKFCSL